MAVGGKGEQSSGRQVYPRSREGYAKMSQRPVVATMGDLRTLGSATAAASAGRLTIQVSALPSVNMGMTGVVLAPKRAVAGLLGRLKVRQRRSDK